MNAQPNELPDELPDDMARALRALDADATRRAVRVDADAVASRVLARLRAEAAPRVLPGRWAVPSLPRWAQVTAAAAMIVVVAGSVVLGVLRPGADRAVAVAVPVAAVALDSLNANELEALLAVTAEVRPVATTVAPTSGSWDELSEAQLRAVLQAVQQVQGETL